MTQNHSDAYAELMNRFKMGHEFEKPKEKIPVAKIKNKKWRVEVPEENFDCRNDQLGPALARTYRLYGKDCDYYVHYWSEEPEMWVRTKSADPHKKGYAEFLDEVVEHINYARLSAAKALIHFVSTGLRRQHANPKLAPDHKHEGDGWAEWQCDLANAKLHHGNVMHWRDEADGCRVLVKAKDAHIEDVLSIVDTAHAQALYGLKTIQQRPKNWDAEACNEIGYVVSGLDYARKALEALLKKNIRGINENILEKKAFDPPKEKYVLV